LSSSKSVFNLLTFQGGGVKQSPKPVKSVTGPGVHP
jgi:hypothetical protein